jgi:small conductance mechanosensitive channel
VTAINIFVTKLITLENKTIYLPNGPLANDTILNFSQQDNIRVDVRVGIAYDADLLHAKSVLQTLLDDTDKLLHHPKPQVLVDELGDSSVNLILRGFVIPSDYREVYYNLMEHAKLTLDKHDIEIPFPQRVVHMKK